MHRYRILYLIGQLSVGGAERQLVYLATQIDRSRFEPIVCSLSTNIPLADELHRAGIELITLPKYLHPFPDITRFWRVLRIVKQCQPALIHSYLFVANTWARITAIACGIPVIVSERSAKENLSRSHRIVNRLLVPWTSYMIANSHRGADIAVRTKAIPADRVTVIHNGISLDVLHSTYNHDQSKEKYQIRESEPIIGVVGRLVTPKDHDSFFHAMALVIQQMPNVKLLCVGDGPRMAEISRLVWSLGLQKHTIFTGIQSDIPRVMSALNILVLSSEWEGFPNVVMEAMAAAKPVVATRVGDIPYLVMHGETGLIVPPKNPEELANAVLFLLRHPEQAVQMGMRGRARVEQNFTLDRMVQETENVYLKVLQG